MLQKILNFVSTELDKKEKIDSEEYKKQSEKCQIVFDELSSTLNEEQKEKLVDLDFEYFMSAGQWKDDGFKEGLESGFKLAVQIILDCLKN